MRIVTAGFGTGRQRMALERGTSPKLSRRTCTREYRLQPQTGYNPREGNRRAWRSSGVSDLPPEILTFRFAAFTSLYSERTTVAFRVPTSAIREPTNSASASLNATLPITAASDSFFIRTAAGRGPGGQSRLVRLFTLRSHSAPNASRCAGIQRCKSRESYVNARVRHGAAENGR